MKTYFIKDGYEHRKEAPTLVEDASTYWNETRIELSGFYRYCVYESVLLDLAPSRPFSDRSPIRMEPSSGRPPNGTLSAASNA